MQNSSAIFVPPQEYRFGTVAVATRVAGGPESKTSWSRIAQHLQPAVLALLLGVFSFLLYCGTAAFSFVWDDRQQIVENAAIKAWSFVPKYFTGNSWALIDPHRPANYYRPLFLLWLKINYSLFGLSPVGWHCASAILNAVVAVQVFWLAHRLLRSDLLAAISALLFAVHPVHIESVAWVSGVTDPLVAACMLGAMLLFISSLERSRSVNWPTYFGALFFFALSLLSKEIATIFPALLIATAAALRKESAERLRIYKYAMPFWALTFAYFVVRHIVLHGFMHSGNSYTVPAFLLTLPEVLSFYARQLVAPFWIAPYADVYRVVTPDVRQFWIPLAFCGALLIMAIPALRYSVNRSIVWVSYAWILLPLLPALYFPLFPPSEVVHDRYLYVSSIGFSILLVLVGQKIATRVSLKAVKLLTFGVVVTLAVLTFVGELSWGSEILLYEHAARLAPNNEAAFLNLGVALLERNDLDIGIAALKRALELNPNSALAAANLGHIFLVNRQYAEAEPMFQRALLLDPVQEGWHEQFAEVELRLGKVHAAEQAARHAIRILPDGVGFHSLLGAVLLAKGDRAGAQHELAEELRLHKDNMAARDVLDRLTQARRQGP